jgi:hypothetical protein
MLRSLKLALIAGSLLVGGTALADRGKDGDGKRGAMGERRAKRMAKFDLNKDGKLDQQERAGMMKEKFDRLDKNHDGVLSFEEAQGMFQRGGFHKRGVRGDHDRGGDRDRRGPDHRSDSDE